MVTCYNNVLYIICKTHKKQYWKHLLLENTSRSRVKNEFHRSGDIFRAYSNYRFTPRMILIAHRFNNRSQ